MFNEAEDYSKCNNDDNTTDNASLKCANVDLTISIEQIHTISSINKSYQKLSDNISNRSES